MPECVASFSVGVASLACWKDFHPQNSHKKNLDGPRQVGLKAGSSATFVRHRDNQPAPLSGAGAHLISHSQIDTKIAIMRFPISRSLAASCRRKRMRRTLP